MTPEYLGRPFTEAEEKIVADQTARLESDIFNNPLLPRSVVSIELVPLPFMAPKWP